MNRAAFLDRDGVINQRPVEGEYVTRWEEMSLLPGVGRAIRLLNQAGFHVVVVTNQRCVAKGLVSTAELESIHQRMCDAVASDGGRIDAVYYCPHETQPACECRKPAPGMLLAASRALSIDLGSSWMIGDSDIDIEAGKRAGCKTARIVTASEELPGTADVIGSSLLEAVGQILARAGARASWIPSSDRQPS